MWDEAALSPVALQTDVATLRPMRRLALAVATLATLASAPSALADDWLPHAAEPTWTYEWT